MSLRKAAYDLCGPPERNLNVILFKQCSLFQLLMCSSLIQGKSSRYCIVAVAIGAGDSPSCVSLALLCFWPLDALLLEDWDIIARSLFLGDKANVRPEGGVYSDSSCPQPPKLDFYILIMTCYSEPSVFSNWGDLSERVCDGRHLRYLLCGLCLFSSRKAVTAWQRGRLCLLSPGCARGDRGSGVLLVLSGAWKRLFLQDHLEVATSKAEGKSCSARTQECVCMGLSIAPLNFILLASGSEFRLLEIIIFFF